MQAYAVREIAEFCAIMAGIAIADRFLYVPLWVWIAVPGLKAWGSILFYMLFLRRVFTKIPRHDPAALIGQSARAMSHLDPEGHVRINGEIWSARNGDDTIIRSGQNVLVTGLRGNTLVVGAPPNGGES